MYKQLLTNTQTKIEYLALLPWYSLDDLMKELQALRKVDFSIVESRKQALQRFNNMTSIAPFSVSQRFPSGKLYICETHGDWSRKFQQLKSSLSMKEKENKFADKQTDPQNVSDSLVAFWNATSTMYDQISRNDGVFSREVFESTFSLIWAEEKESEVSTLVERQLNRAVTVNNKLTEVLSKHSDELPPSLIKEIDDIIKK